MKRMNREKYFYIKSYLPQVKSKNMKHDIHLRTRFDDTDQRNLEWCEAIKDEIKSYIICTIITYPERKNKRLLASQG